MITFCSLYVLVLPLLEDGFQGENINVVKCEVPTTVTVDINVAPNSIPFNLKVAKITASIRVEENMPNFERH
jgi:hypothetical protein